MIRIPPIDNAPLSRGYGTSIFSILHANPAVELLRHVQVLTAGRLQARRERRRGRTTPCSASQNNFPGARSGWRILLVAIRWHRVEVEMYLI